MTVANDKQFVFDTSAVLAMILPDEKDHFEAKKLVEIVADRQMTCYAPTLVTYEVTNALKSAVKRKRITALQAQQLLSTFLDLPIKLVKVHAGAVLDLALEMELSAYDAAYVWLALSKKAQLLTLDQEIVHKFGT